MPSILMIAPAADPTDVGEAWVAANWIRRLSSEADVTVLTFRRQGHPPLRELVDAEVVSWDEPAALCFAERFNSLAMPWYPAFHRRCTNWIRNALAGGRTFDVGFQPVPVAMRYPSPLASFDIPYVLGPVGGGLDSPTTFRGEDTAPWYMGLRRVDKWRLRHDRWLRRTYERAAVVCGIAPYVEDALHGLDLRRLVLMSETGIEEVPPPVHRDPARTPVRLLFVGRVIRTKGVRDLVRAMALLGDLPLRLDVVGDGFDRRACEDEAAKLGVTQRVVFHGSQPFERVTDFYRDADIFVFPSYREPGGNAPYEAMSYGLPMIVADRGGPSHSVADDCGVKIPVTDPERFSRDIASAIRRLATDAELRSKMGAAARENVATNGTWDARVAVMTRLFGEIAATTRARLM